MHKFLRISLLLGGLTILSACGGDGEEEPEVSQEAQAVSPEPEAEAATQLPLAGAMSEALVGSWQSTEDAKAQIVFHADGTAFEHYEGRVLASGTWDVHHETETDLLVLTRVIEGETYTYTVLTVEPEKLVLSYRTRGNTLSYTRVK